MIEPGTEVVCPSCGATMVVCIRRPELGSTNWTDCFEAREFSNEHGATPNCPRCWARFFDPNRGVYTREFGYTW